MNDSSNADHSAGIDTLQPDLSFQDHPLTALGQFQSNGNLELLVEAGRELVSVLHRQSPAPSQALYDKSLEMLATVVSFQQTYTENCDDDTLLSTVSFYRQSVSEDMDKRSHQSFEVWSLGDTLCALYARTGDQTIHTEAVTLLREALDASAKTRFESLRISLLVSLAFALAQHPQFLPDQLLQNEMKALLKEALVLSPPGHPFRHMVLVEYAWEVLSLFDVGDNVDLEIASDMAEEALRLRPPGHPLRQLALSCCAQTSYCQYQTTGNEDFLNISLMMNQEVLNLRPPGHHRRSCTLSNLAGVLIEQFELFGGNNKLLEASRLTEEAIALASPSSPLYLLNFHVAADSLKLQGNYSGAIEIYRKAMETPIDDNILKSACLHGMAECLVACSEGKNYMDNLIKATELHERALVLRPPGYVHHICTLTALADTKLRAYKVSKDKSQVAEAMDLYRRALESKHRGHPMKAATQYAFAKALLEHGTQEYWNEALDRISIANTDDLQGTTQKRLQLMSATVYSIERALQQIYTSDVQLAQKALTVYIQAIRLLPRAAHLGMSMPLRLKTLKGTEHLCRVAAIRALLLGDISTAVESLEEGRNVFWTQALRLRSPSLNRLPREEQKRLQELLRKLEQSLHVESVSDGGGLLELEKRSAQQRQLNAQVQSMLDEIRSRPDFSNFMSIEPFIELTKAANRGAVVLLLATEMACFAILILNSQEFKYLRLHDLTPERLQWLRTRFERVDQQVTVQSCVGNSSPEQRLGILKIASPKTATPPLDVVLNEIWKYIVHPIVLELTLPAMHGRSRPRLYWCPVGDFAHLPLHAAYGISLDTKVTSISDFVVSSYIPSLSSLINARRNSHPIRRGALNALLVAEANVGSYGLLPSAEREVEDVAKLMASAGVRATVDTNPSSHTVLENLNAVHILHLACHGVQTPDALQSHFVLRGDKLSVADLVKLTLPNATLAFLSACETAKGDLKQPDQVVHLAASMLFCGFRSVVGTMWTMDDRDGPEMAKSIYTELLKTETFELDDVPYALDDAVQKLRKAGAQPSRWATFVHMGA